MTEHLHYGLTEKGFQIVGPKQLIDSATWRHGAMLENIRRPEGQRFLERSSSPDGQEVTLEASLAGMGYTPGVKAPDKEGWSQAVLDLIYQIEKVAHNEGRRRDPRIAITTFGVRDLSGIEVDFVRPDDTDSELTRLSQAAVAHYGHLDGLYDTTRGAGDNVHTEYETSKGFRIQTDLSQSHPGPAVLSTLASMYSPDSERIQLQGTDRYPVARARLAALMGVIAILPDEQLFRTGVFAEKVRMRTSTAEVKESEVTTPEMRRLVEDIGIVAERYGSKSPEYIPNTVYWGRENGRYQVLLSSQEGEKGRGTAFTDASLIMDIFDRREKESIRTRLEFKHTDRRTEGPVNAGARLSVEMSRLVRDEVNEQFMPTEKLDVPVSASADYAEVLAALVRELEALSAPSYHYDRQQSKRLVRYVGNPVIPNDPYVIEHAIERLLAQIKS